MLALYSNPKWLQAMDTMEFTRKGPTNRLRLVKYLAQESSVL